MNEIQGSHRTGGTAVGDYRRKPGRKLALMLGSALALSAGWSTAARAQDNPAGESAPEKVGDKAGIIVTGSLIRSGFGTPTPVSSIGTADFERVATPDIADVINQIPSVRASLTPASSGNLFGMAASNFIDLRGLGYQRTQILIDGRRYAPNTPAGGVNITSIPQALIRSVDIVTGGASATYGSDAVAGVVNLRLDDRFTGIKGRIQGGITDHNDYRNYLASLAYGTSFGQDRFHLVLSAESARNSGIDRIGDRKWGNNPAIIANPAYTAANGEPMRLLVTSDARFSNIADGGVINTPGLLKGLQFTPDGQAVPFAYGSSVSATSMIGGDGTGATEWNIGAVPSRRFAGFGRLTYDPSDAVTLYTELNYARLKARYPGLAQTEQLTIKADNAYLPQSIRDIMAQNGIASFTMGRASNDYDRVMVDLDIATLQSVTGADIRLGNKWSASLYYSYGHTSNVQNLENSRITSRFNQSLDAVRDPSTGAVVCRSSIASPGNGCVPINLFGVGNASDAANDYIHGTSYRRWGINQHVVSGTLRGELADLWAGPVSVGFGAEYREWSVDTTADAISAAQGYRNGGTVPYSGRVKVKEAFGEVQIPLAVGESWAKDLGLDLAARATDYSTSGTVYTWKAGLNYAINDSIRLRATRSRDIRAPGLEELFSLGSTTTLGVQDPLLGGASYIVHATNTGNPNLKPEKADTLTVGAVFTPSFAPRLKVSVDYYDIKLKEAIIALTPAMIVNLCYTSSPQLCSLITRDDSGLITTVSNGPVNMQQVRVRGIDFEGVYSLPLGSDRLDMRLMATYIDKAEMDNGVTRSDLVDAVNQPTIAALGGNPRWRFNAAANYVADRFRLSLTGRYVGGGRIDPAYTSKDLDVLRVSGRLYFDLSGEYTLYGKGSDGSLVLFGTIQNLTDKDPPITGVGGYGTTRALYDTIGRQYTAGIRFKF